MDNKIKSLILDGNEEIKFIGWIDMLVKVIKGMIEINFFQFEQFLYANENAESILSETEKKLFKKIPDYDLYVYKLATPSQIEQLVKDILEEYYIEYQFVYEEDDGNKIIRDKEDTELVIPPIHKKMDEKDEIKYCKTLENLHIDDKIDYIEYKDKKIYSNKKEDKLFYLTFNLLNYLYDKEPDKFKTIVKSDIRNIGLFTIEKDQEHIKMFDTNIMINKNIFEKRYVDIWLEILMILDFTIDEFYFYLE